MNKRKLISESIKNKFLAGIIKESTDSHNFIYDNNGQNLNVEFTFYPGNMGDLENPPENPEVDIVSITDESGNEMFDIDVFVLDDIREMAANQISNDEPNYDLDENSAEAQKDFYPEFKEMRYTNISDVRNDLKDLNSFFKEASAYVHSNEFLKNDFMDSWRKIERSIKLLDINLKIKS